MVEKLVLLKEHNKFRRQVFNELYDLDCEYSQVLPKKFRDKLWITLNKLKAGNKW